MVKMILDKQIKNYLNLGFHKYLDLSEQEYINSFPTTIIQPVEYKGIFDYPVSRLRRFTI